jgi:hypothetical protein
MPFKGVMATMGMGGSKEGQKDGGGRCECVLWRGRGGEGANMIAFMAISRCLAFIGMVTSPRGKCQLGDQKPVQRGMDGKTASEHRD